MIRASGMNTRRRINELKTVAAARGLPHSIATD